MKTHQVSFFVIFFGLELLSPRHERLGHKCYSPCYVRFQMMGTCSLTLTIKLITLKFFLFGCFKTFKDKKEILKKFVDIFQQKLSGKRARLRLCLRHIKQCFQI